MQVPDLYKGLPTIRTKIMVSLTDLILLNTSYFSFYTKMGTVKGRHDTTQLNTCFQLVSYYDTEAMPWYSMADGIQLMYMERLVQTIVRMSRRFHSDSLTITICSDFRD